MHYYQRDLAFIHDRGYGGYADRCAPGFLELLEPVRGGGASVGTSFGDAELPAGLRSVTGSKTLR